MGKMEFGLDLVHISSFVFGCISISGTVPDALALTASTGILLGEQYPDQCSKQREGCCIHFPFALCMVGVQLASLLPSYFVPVYLSCCWMQKAVACIRPGHDSVPLEGRALHLLE